MIRLKFSIELNYDIAPPGSDFIFNIHAAQTPHQIVVTESLTTSLGHPHPFFAAQGIARCAMTLPWT